MNKDNFVLYLKQHFGSAGDALVDSIQDWLEYERFTEDEIKDIYNAVIDNHEETKSGGLYFPSLKKIKSYYYNYASRRKYGYLNEDSILNYCKSWSLEKIIKIYKQLFFNKSERNAFENYYISVFQPLYYKYSVCVDKYGIKKGTEIVEETKENIFNKREINYNEEYKDFREYVEQRKKEEVEIKDIMKEMFDG